MNNETPAFDQLALGKPVIQALNDVGYEKPSPIQAQTIPVLLKGQDVLGQAQTGTGKTAAFALPALTQIDLKNRAPQVLVLAPTRELAIQVAEAFKTYAAHMKGFHVLPVYGGQDYRVQTRALDRGVHVIVGTPGRIMDHIRRGNIKLNELRTFILDEADEMLRMGFIDDVEWVLEKLPEKRQMALFSATMPRQIARIAERYLNDPQIVKIEVKTRAADTIRQRFWPVTGRNKLDALTRILEAEEIDAMLIFVRTKTSTVEISEKLEARGYASAPLNGDIQQKQRERTVDQLKKGKLDIIVATDVAARGLDVARVSHVLNYDIPSDTEAYIHRIGRTGRAGRSGEAILFVAPREKRMKQTIERATGKSIDQMEMPSTDEINKQRIEKFKQRIHQTIENENLSFYESLVAGYTTDNTNHTPAQMAAALAHLLQGDVPFLQPVSSKRSDRDHTDRKSHERSDRTERSRNKHDKKRERHSAKERDGDHPSHSETEHRPSVPHEKQKHDKPKIPMERFRIEVGQMHDVQASNIVGAIANEAGLESQFIGTVKIHDKYSTVELPEGMPKAIFKDLKKVWVCGQKLQISKLKKERGDYGADRNDNADSHSHGRKSEGHGRKSQGHGRKSEGHGRKSAGKDGRHAGRGDKRESKHHAGSDDKRSGSKSKPPGKKFTAKKRKAKKSSDFQSKDGRSKDNNSKSSKPDSKKRSKQSS